MAYEQERAYLAEKKAKLVTYEDNELLFRRQLVRNWPAEPDKIIEDALTYLYNYGSASNTLPSQAVTDPKAERLTYSGTWRVVKNEKASKATEAQWPGITGIVQTLRYGFAQTLSWDECRVVDNKEMPGNSSEVTGIDDTISDDPNDVVVLEWVNLDPAYTRSMLSSGILANNTVSDPAPRGNTTGYIGVWHKISTAISESQLEDGSGVIRVVLARPQYTLNAYDTYLNGFYGATQEGVVHYLWNVPRDIAQTIITTWKGTRKSASASLNADDTVNLVLRVFDPGDTPVSLEDYSDFLCSATETTYYYWGVPDPDAAAYDITQLAGAGDNGVRYQKTVNFNSQDATFTVVIRKIVATARAPYTLKQVKDAALEDRTETVKFSQSTLPTITAATQGNISLLDITINPDCTNDSRETIITSTENVEIVSWADPKGTAYEGTYQNWVGATGQALLEHFLTTTGITVTNFNLSMNVTMNDDGTFSGRVSATPYTTVIGTAPTYSGFSYWDTSIHTVPPVEADDNKEGIAYYVLEHFHWAIEYYNSTAYDEEDVYGQIANRGAHGTVSMVDSYFRLKLLIGCVLEEIDDSKEVNAGIGDLTDMPTAGIPATWAEAPPIL